MTAPLGLILAGGGGTRMGGVSKTKLMLGTQTTLARADARLAPQVLDLGVNANSAVSTTRRVLPDTMPGSLGPLAGILTGLDWALENGRSHVVTVAVDTPFFPCDLVPRLQLAGERHPQGLAVAATADGLHGTFGLWPTALRDDLVAFLTDGGRKVTGWTDRHNAALATFPETTPPSFFNINTPEDLEVARVWI